MDESGFRSAALIVEPVGPGDSDRCMTCGHIDGRPAVRLLPRVDGDGIEWGQDSRILMAKAIAYLASPAAEAQFWSDWREAIEADELRVMARQLQEAWAEATHLELFLEMFAAYVMSPEHSRWKELPGVLSCLDAWRGVDA